LCCIKQWANLTIALKFIIKFHYLTSALHANITHQKSICEINNCYGNSKAKKWNQININTYAFSNNLQQINLLNFHIRFSFQFLNIVVIPAHPLVGEWWRSIVGTKCTSCIHSSELQSLQYNIIINTEATKANEKWEIAKYAAG